MKKILLLLMLPGIAWVSAGCSKEVFDPANPVIGLWELEGYTNLPGESIINYVRKNKFDAHKPGYKFMVDGTMTSNQLAGWCATPPVTYQESAGDWKLKGDKLTMKINYWGGIMEKHYSIVRLDKHTLQLKELD